MISIGGKEQKPQSILPATAPVPQPSINTFSHSAKNCHTVLMIMEDDDNQNGGQSRNFHHCSERNFDSVHSNDNISEDDEGDEMTANDDDNDDANLVDVTLSNREAAAHQGISPLRSPLGHSKCHAPYIYNYELLCSPTQLDTTKP